MSTAQVNLLPPELGAEDLARRIRLAAGAAVLGWVVVLGGVHTVTLAAVAETRDARDAQQTEVTARQATVAELLPFGQLLTRRDEGNTLLTAAMDREVAVAQLLDEIARAFPTAASMRSITLDVSTSPAIAGVVPVATDPAGAPDPAADSGPIGGLTFEGYTIEGYAPGVQSVLEAFSQGNRLVDGYAVSAQEEDLEGVLVTGFSGRADVTKDALTGRYANGLPPTTPPAEETPR